MKLLKFFCCIICVGVISLGLIGCGEFANNSISLMSSGYTRTYETGTVTFKNSPSFQIELTQNTLEKEFYIASGLPSVITATEATIINCHCYVEGKEYVVIFLDLDMGQTIKYEWVATQDSAMNTNMESYFDARPNDNPQGLTPFRVTFEEPTKPFLMFDSIRGKICVVDFTSFF